jgi:hypothetical protein
MGEELDKGALLGGDSEQLFNGARRDDILL